MMGNFEIVDKNVLFDNGLIYKVVYSISLSDQTIYYLININDFSDLKFCYLCGDDEYEEIRDKEKLREVVLELNRNVNMFIR